MAKKLAVLGSVNVDHIIHVARFARAGETLLGKDYHIAYGGKGANQAVAAARLGAKVDFIACIGSDDIGHSMKAHFVQQGINTHHVYQVEEVNTGVAMIQVSEAGENTIVISAGANGCLDENIVNQSKEVIGQAEMLLMQLETPLHAVFLAAQIARSHGTRVVLNPAPAQPLTDELLALVDMITPNETETEVLTGIKVIDEQSAMQAAQSFHQKGIDTVLITLGSKGVYCSHLGVGKLIAGFSVQAKDTTAAGDTFNAALLTALLEEKPLFDAVRFAHGAAAISVTRMGAQPSIPTRAETEAFLQQYS